MHDAVPPHDLIVNFRGTFASYSRQIFWRVCAQLITQHGWGSMRRTFFISSAMPALGLMLMPLITNAVASEVDVTSSVNPNSTPAPAISAPAIELREDAVSDTGACAKDRKSVVEGKREAVAG